MFNRYSYTFNDPVNLIDPDGKVPVETVWDAANVGMGIASAGANAAAGNYGKAAVDVIGIVADVVATALPYVPGGAGTAIKAARGADKVADAARGANNTADATKGPKIGGGGTLDKLSPNEIKRIQNAADRTGKDIAVVGSRVNPNKTLRPNSDFDFVVDANSKVRNNLSRSLPGAKNIREGLQNNKDVFKEALRTNEPHVIFRPGGG